MDLKHSLILPSFLLIYFNIVDAAVTGNRVLYDVYGNILRQKEHQYTNPKDCCVMPTCDEAGRCFETISCGHICSQGNYRPAYHGWTPGYKLKSFYTNFECHFEECQVYKFLCAHCPDPNMPDFSIYTVRKDCTNCYY